MRTCGNILKREQIALRNELAITYERKLSDLKLKLRKMEMVYEEQVLKNEYDQKDKLLDSAKKLSDKEKLVKSCEKEIKISSDQIKVLLQENE